MKISIIKKQIGLNKTIIVNICSTVLLQGITFFTIPIFTRVLGTEQYGLYAIFNSWVSIFTIIIPLGVGSCIGSGMYYYKDEYFDFRNNIIFFSTLVSLIMIGLFAVIYKVIYPLVEYDLRLYIVLLLMAFSSSVIGLISGILIYEKKAIMNSILSIFLSITNITLSLILIFNFKFDNIYEGRVYGHFIPYFLVSLFLIIYIITTKPTKLNLKYLRYGLLVGGPVVLHQLAHIILGQSDRVMMQKMNISESNIGIYSLFYSYCGVLSIILGAFNTSFSPFYYEYIDKNDKNGIILKSKQFIEVFTIICAGFLLLSREVSYIMANSDYYSGINLIPIFVGSTYFVFMYQFAVNYEFFYRKTSIIACGTIGAALLNIILNVFFIKKFGMYGAAYATILSYLALYVFHYIIVNFMKEKRFYLSLKYYVIGILIIVLCSFIFYIFEKFIYLRWILGGLLGLFEMYRIYIRKAII